MLLKSSQRDAEGGDIITKQEGVDPVTCQADVTWAATDSAVAWWSCDPACFICKQEAEPRRK